jgi:hypothetical protein
MCKRVRTKGSTQDDEGIGKCDEGCKDTEHSRLRKNGVLGGSKPFDGEPYVGESGRYGG